MGDVGPIEPLTTSDKQLRGEQFFSGEDSCFHLMDHGGLGTLDPRILDDDGRIAHSGNEVDKKSVAMRLEKPNRIASLALETFFAKDLQSTDRGFRCEEKIEVLGVAKDSCVLLQREGSGNGIRYFSFLKERQNLAK